MLPKHLVLSPINKFILRGDKNKAYQPDAQGGHLPSRELFVLWLDLLGCGCPTGLRRTDLVKSELVPLPLCMLQFYSQAPAKTGSAVSLLLELNKPLMLIFLLRFQQTWVKYVVIDSRWPRQIPGSPTFTLRSLWLKKKRKEKTKQNNNAQIDLKTLSDPDIALRGLLN